MRRRGRERKVVRMAPTTIPARRDVPLENTWDAVSVFADDERWEEALQAIERRLPDLAEFRGHLADGSGTLADRFTAAEQVADRRAHV